jgi:hypothetical protein
MIPSHFNYHNPTELSEVFSLLNEHSGKAKVLAGGHSLLPMMKFRFAEPGHLVDLDGVPFTKRNIPFNDIEDVVIADEFHKGNRIPEVWVITNNAKKPYKLKQLGSDSNLVYENLKSAANL